MSEYLSWYQQGELLNRLHRFFIHRLLRKASVPIYISCTMPVPKQNFTANLECQLPSDATQSVPRCSQHYWQNTTIKAILERTLTNQPKPNLSNSRETGPLNKTKGSSRAVQIVYWLHWIETRAVQPMATCRQSPYLDTLAIDIVTSFLLWHMMPMALVALAAPVLIMTSFATELPCSPLRTYVHTSYRV